MAKTFGAIIRSAQNAFFIDSFYDSFIHFFRSMGLIQDTLQRVRNADWKTSIAGWLGDLRLNPPKILGLQARLTAPYLLLTILLALIGTYVITRLVTASIRERFDNQLLEASRVTADGIVQREKTHLAYLRLMAFTEGIPEALASRDTEKARELLWPLILNNKIEAVSIVDQTGKEMITLVKDPDSNEYFTSQDTDFSSYGLVRNIIGSSADSLGDKYCELLPTVFGPYIFSSAPVRTAQGEFVGLLMIGSRAESLLTSIKSQALADIVVLKPDGKVLAATLLQPPEGFAAVELSDAALAQVSPTLARNLTLFSRSYQAIYSPLVIRSQSVGILLVMLPSDYVFSTGATSRNWFVVIFAIGTLAVFGIGYWLARNISKPIIRLRSVSQAVAAGNLQLKTELKRGDEIGDLALAFDVMTRRLRERTEEAARLYVETVQRNRELAEANVKLQSTQHQLVQSEKLAAVGQLTAGIVHDVKNPLAVTIGILDELGDDKSASKETKSSLQTARDSAWRASTIITDLLKFARQSTPEMKRQDLVATVETALRLTEFLARKASVTVIKDIPQRSVLATYDAQQIEQVLINLIQNAIQAMPKGGHLRLVFTQVKDAIAIAVQDTGSGISSQNLLKIFDPFFTTKPPGQGTGLGLSVSYGIVARHGGRIDVASEVGKGSTFTVLLPVQPPAMVYE